MVDLVFGPGEDEPDGTADTDLMRAFQAYELGVLPSGKGLDDEEPEMLNLMLMVKEERLKAEAQAAKDAARKK